MSVLEYHRQMCALVTFIAKHEVLLSSPSLHSDDTRPQNLSS